jgi:uncharacterized protein (DUF362 family)
MLLRDRRPVRSRVAILSAGRYSEDLAELVFSGLREFRLEVREKSVLLKPNIVEYFAGVDVNTNPVLVAAPAETFLKLGARSIVVGEGPGIRVPTRANFARLDHLWLPRTVLASNFTVSMPKIKTHHWAGVTLSMKNMFGIVPGTKYGWPKNVLHWKGIHRSILDICATLPIHFVIADGVIAMEGNGPLHGTHRHLGKIVLADDPVAADFMMCARLMGLKPSLVWHLDRAARFLGNGPGRIDLIAERLPQQVVPFDVLPEFAHLQIHA